MIECKFGAPAQHGDYVIVDEVNFYSKTHFAGIGRVYGDTIITPIKGAIKKKRSGALIVVDASVVNAETRKIIDDYILDNF